GARLEHVARYGSSPTYCCHSCAVRSRPAMAHARCCQVGTPTSHSQTDPSQPADTSVFGSSGLKTTVVTHAPLSSVPMGAPLETSHSRTFASAPPEARTRPSGLKARAKTELVWPR